MYKTDPFVDVLQLPRLKGHIALRLLSMCFISVSLFHKYITVIQLVITSHMDFLVL